MKPTSSLLNIDTYARELLAEVLRLELECEAWGHDMILRTNDNIFAVAYKLRDALDAETETTNDPR